jgi:hypothetical protein
MDLDGILSKTCPKSFRPIWRFIKSIPGARFAGALVDVGVPLRPPLHVDDVPHGARRQRHLLLSFEPAANDLALLSPILRPQAEDNVAQLQWILKVLEGQGCQIYLYRMYQNEGK